MSGCKEVLTLAVPSGYVWVRELDPNAVYQGGVLKALGRTYKPGEFYLEGGRAYIPSPVPEGYRWIREYFPTGQVSYDPKTKTLTLPGGLNLPQSSLVTVGGRTYAPASLLAQAYQTYAATYQPKQPTAEEVKRLSDVYMQIYGPLADVARERLGFNLKKIQETAEQQRRLAEAAYQTALSNLQQAETRSWNAIMKSALARGLGASPLTSYEQRKVAETYAPEYQKLETERAAQLANIASQAALAAEELALQGRQAEAEWASKIAEYAYNALQSSAAEQKKAVQTLADYFEGLAEAEAKAKQKAAELAWEREKAYLPYLYPRADTLVPYKYGPTPYQQQELALRRELGLKDYLYGPTPYQQQSLAWQREKASMLSPQERIIDLRGKAAASVQAALDELWRTTPGGPSYDAVVRTVNQALSAVKTDLARAGMAKKDIDETIELLIEYASAATGVPMEIIRSGVTTVAPAGGTKLGL